MPSTPLARPDRSESAAARRRCRSEGMRKSTSTSPSSFAASSQPARAMVQKFAALLLTNASFSFLAGAGEPPHGRALPAFFFLPQPETIAASAQRRTGGLDFFHGCIWLIGFKVLFDGEFINDRVLIGLARLQFGGGEVRDDWANPENAAAPCRRQSRN